MENNALGGGLSLGSPEADLDTRIQVQMVYLWGGEVGWRVAGLGRSGKLIRGMLSD